MKFRIKYAQQVVGFFLLASVLALVAVLVFMGANQRWFARNYSFFTRFNSAEGITVGMPIKLKGFEIGKVTGFELTYSNRVRVNVDIYSDYISKVRPDSMLELAVATLGIGGGSMNLLPGMNMLPAMEENSFLPSSDSALGKTFLAQGLVDRPQVNDQIKGILDQVAPLLIDVRTTAGAVTRVLNDFSGAVEGKSDNQISGLLTDSRNTLTRVEAALTGSLNNADTLMTSLNSIASDVSRLTSQLQDPRGLIPKLLDPQGSLKTILDDKNVLFNQITSILGQVNSTLVEVKGLTAYLNRSTPQISSLVEDARQTIKKTGDVMEGLSNNPILRGGIPEQKPQASTVQGQRDESF
jgi:phospholipid/cholesterol/gamma-HCH transport system substrate-binding protein